MRILECKAASFNAQSTKDFKFQIKSVDEKGSFTGLAAVYGNLDLGGDVIAPGAFTKTIGDHGGNVPILWQHDSREPIGLGTLEDSPEGLVIKGQLVMESPVAQKAYALMKAGVLKGLSIGYDTVVSEWNNEREIRTLKEVRLWEVSLVTFPMNPLATVNGVKAMASKLDASVEMLTESLKQFDSERKAGRTLSAATLERLRAAHGAMTEAMGHLSALIDTTTSDDAAGKSAAVHNEGPDLHPAFNSLEQLMRNSFQR